MLKNKRTIKDLADLQGRVYLYFPDSDVRDHFITDANEEGVTYGDGVPLTEREPDSIMALNENMTVNFVGFAGHMHFMQPSSESQIRSKPLIRVDYGRYAAGDDYYIIEYRMVKQKFFLSDIDYRG